MGTFNVLLNLRARVVFPAPGRPMIWIMGTILFFDILDFYALPGVSPYKYPKSNLTASGKEIPYLVIGMGFLNMELGKGLEPSTMRLQSASSTS